MPSKQTTITDDFNRADGALGSNWTTSIKIATPPLISSNVAVGTGTVSERSGAQWTGSAVNNDQWIRAKIAALGSTYVGLWVRAGSAGDSATGYYTTWEQAINRVQIFKTTASVLKVHNFGAPLAVGDFIELWVIGTTLSVYLNDVFADSVTDSTYASGNVGIEMGFTGTGLDDVTAGNFTSSNYLPRR